MDIVKVSLTGVNEKLPKKDVIDFLRTHPLAEIGIAVSREYCTYNSLRFNHIRSLINEYRDVYEPGRHGTLALQVNGSGQDGLAGWPFCVSVGVFPNTLIMLTHFPDLRIQLCHRGYIFYPRYAPLLVGSRDLKELIAPSARMILPYSQYTCNYVQKFMSTVNRKGNLNQKYDILYDASFGRCRDTGRYRPQLCKDVRQGYTGGFSVENITGELERIDAAQVNPNPEIWINAKGKLRNHTLKTLDLDKADKFYDKVMEYRAAHTK